MARTSERNLQDLRTLAEALSVQRHDSGETVETVAGEIGVSRGYLSDALNPQRDELQFQARLLVPFCRATHSVLVLRWLADRLGYVLVERARAEHAGCVVNETLDVADVAGQLSRRVREAVANDGRLDAVETADIVDLTRRVQREAADVERAVQQVAR